MAARNRFGDISDRDLDDNLLDEGRDRVLDDRIVDDGAATPTSVMDDQQMTPRDPVKTMGAIAAGGLAVGYYFKTKRKKTEQWAAWSVAIFAAVLAFLAYQQQQSLLAENTAEGDAG